MASFGDALTALEDFRTDLVQKQMTAHVPDALGLAFRTPAGVADESPLRNVHATGVGVRGDARTPGPTDFVIKVYVFEKAAVSSAETEPFLARAFQGVEIDVEYLPVQVAFAKTKTKKPKAK